MFMVGIKNLCGWLSEGRIWEKGGERERAKGPKIIIAPMNDDEIIEMYYFMNISG